MKSFQWNSVHLSLFLERLCRPEGLLLSSSRSTLAQKNVLMEIAACAYRVPTSIPKRNPPIAIEKIPITFSSDVTGEISPYPIVVSVVTDQ